MCLNVHTSHYWMTYLTYTIDCDVSECPYIPLLDEIFDEHNRLWCVSMSIHPITGWHIWRTQLIVMCLNVHTLPLLDDIFNEHDRLWCVWMSLHSHYWMTYLTNTIDCDVSECPYIPLLDDIFDKHNRLWCVWMSIHPITGWHIWRKQ